MPTRKPSGRHAARLRRDGITARLSCSFNFLATRDIDADYGDCGIEFLRHGVLLVFGAPGQLKTLAGQEHGRTIPLPDHRRGDDITGRYSIREKSPAEAGQKFREECS